MNEMQCLDLETKVSKVCGDDLSIYFFDFNTCTDEETIIDILCNCNQSQRSQLKQSFKSITKEDLLLVMREELSGNFLELSLAMLREPLAFHIDLINVLLKVCNFMIDIILQRFQCLYKISLFYSKSCENTGTQRI